MKTKINQEIEMLSVRV